MAQGISICEVIKVGDEVTLRGTDEPQHLKVVAFDKIYGLYLLNDWCQYHRYEFIPVKWDGDKVGNTGIGVCAKNGSENVD